MKNKKRRNTNQNLKLKSVLKESEDKKFITSLINTLNDAYDELWGTDPSDDFFNQISNDTPLNLLYKEDLESLGVLEKLKNLESPEPESEPDNTDKKELWNSFILELEERSKVIWQTGDEDIAKNEKADFLKNGWRSSLKEFFDESLKPDIIKIYTEDEINLFKETFTHRCLSLFIEFWSISPGNEDRVEDEVTNISEFLEEIKEIFPEPSSEESSKVPKCSEHPDVDLTARRKGWYCAKCEDVVLTFEEFPKPDDSPKP